MDKRPAESSMTPQDTPTPLLPDWRNADPENEPDYVFWVSALTSEGLHAKSDIALLLAMQSRSLAAAQAAIRYALEDGLIQPRVTLECRDVLRKALAPQEGERDE
jgi:hypothetical protein